MKIKNIPLIFAVLSYATQSNNMHQKAKSSEASILPNSQAAWLDCSAEPLQLWVEAASLP